MGIYLSYNPTDRQLLIKTTSDTEGSFLTTTLKITLGFSNKASNSYVLNVGKLSNPELYAIVREILDLIKNEKLKYHADNKTTDLIKEAYKELVKRQQIKLTAKKLLKTKSNFGDTLASNMFKRTLKPYQKEPVRLMINLPYSANFSVPGSGKTTMLYAAYSQLKAADIVKKLLIIAPSPAYIAWNEEYEKCFNSKPKIARITGPKYRRVRYYHFPERYEIFITTYQTAASDVDELSALLQTDMFLLVLDESHNIKRFAGGIWSAAVRKLSPFAERRVILTGTPVPNSLLDLWSQFYFLDPDIIGPQAKFINITGKKDAIELLRDKLMPFYRRVKKKELDLPNPIFQSVMVKAPKLQQKIYDSIKRATLEELEYPRSDRNLLDDMRRALMIRLMQAASNPSLLYEKSEEFNMPEIQKDKISKFIEPSIVDAIRNYSKFETPIKLIACQKLAKQLLEQDKNKKIIIWSVWIKNLRILEKQLKIYNPVVIYGDIPINEEKDPIDNRELRIIRFKKDPACRILIANPGACGESISLHDVCHDAIYMDRTFNAGQYMQSLDRIHRVGLDPLSKTNYYLLQVEDTIDETINRRLDEKRARMAKVLNEDFEALNLETNLDEVNGIIGDSQKDFDETIKDLKNDK